MLIERNIKEKWVAQILCKPSISEPDGNDPELRHALGRIPECGDRALRVVYNETMKPWLIVTAFFDRKAGRKI